jgi:hypothetical protein
MHLPRADQTGGRRLRGMGAALPRGTSGRLDKSRVVETRHPKSLRLRMSKEHALMEYTDTVTNIQNMLRGGDDYNIERD